MEHTTIIQASEAQKLLDTMIGQHLQWAIKSPDVELFDLGFGENQEGLPPYVIHGICPVKIVSHQERTVRVYQGDTSSESFRKETENLLGKQILRIALSDKNDLWLDLGAYWIIFVTFADGEESWRFFRPHQQDAHLVATDKCLELQ